MFEGVPAVQVRVGFGHRQFQRCARARKSMEIPFPARLTIARSNIYPSFEQSSLNPRLDKPDLAQLFVIFQRCARSQKIAEIPSFARSITARLIFLLLKLLLSSLMQCACA